MTKHATMEMASPLRWPTGKERTPAWGREEARFHTRLRVTTMRPIAVRKKLTIGHARDGLLADLERLGAQYVVISTDLTLRNDGLPYSSQRQPDDPGAAVYFNLGDEELVFACDRWTCVQDNIHAITLTIGAIRGIERWGSGDMLRQAWRGFAALPPSGEEWRAVFNLRDTSSLSDAKKRYWDLARQAHPDCDGNPHEMVRLNAAMEAAEKELADGQ